MKGNTRKVVPPTGKLDLRAIVGVSIGAILIVCLFIAYTTQSANATNAASVSKDPRFAQLTVGTSMTNEVPATLPAGGVTVNNQFVLRPLAQVQQPGVKITAQQAITTARTYANAKSFAATTLLSSFTSIASVPPAGATERSNAIQNVSAWIVTFTTDHPQNVIIGKMPAPGRTPPTYSPRHFNIVINAQTGVFILGFFTP